MLSAQLGSSNAYYGNLQLASSQAPLYIWGAWEVIGHYQPPLTEEEIVVIEERQAPEPVIDHTETIHRLQREARMTEIAHAPIARRIRQMKPKKYDDEDDAYFILM